MNAPDGARKALLAADHVVPHTDADGLAAGALALRTRGEGADKAVLLGRGQTPFGPAAPLPPGSVAVLDWGARTLLRPGLLVDHHAPEAEARADQTLFSGYLERPETSTAALVRRLVPDGPAWLAAVGAFGDLGDAAFALPECAGAPRGTVRRLVPLVNAPRRLLDGPVCEALALLVESPSAADALNDPRLGALEDARQAWRSELGRVRRTPPVVGETFALIRFSSSAQVHPLVAVQWQRRLAPRVVIAANDGYLAGRVNFSVRGGSGDLRRLLREALPEAEGEFAHGHDVRPAGASIPSSLSSSCGGSPPRAARAGRVSEPRWRRRVGGAPPEQARASRRVVALERLAEAPRVRADVGYGWRRLTETGRPPRPSR